MCFIIVSYIYVLLKLISLMCSIIVHALEIDENFVLSLIIVNSLETWLTKIN
jgi:hypothetical protein